jgi:VanZ family protein
LLLTVLFLAVFGAADEIAQDLWVQGRFGQLGDWTADVLGGLVGVTVARLVVGRVVLPLR